MRVLVIHNQYRSDQASGENRAVERQIELLGAAGHEVVSFERSSDEIADFSVRRKLAVPARIVWSHSARREMRAFLRSHTPDVIHIHNTFPLLSPSILAPCAARAPVVVTLHNYRLLCPQGQLFREGRPCEDCVGRIPWRGVAHACYRDSRAATVPLAVALQVHRTLDIWSRHVAAFVALSAFSRAKLAEGGVVAEKLHALPNFSPKPAQSREGPGDYFLFLGRLSREKGPDIAARAWRPGLGKFLVVGDGPLRPVVERLAADGGDSVQFLGMQPPDQAMELLRNARALIAPSRCYEACPLVVSEAFALGVPVIAPALGAFGEMVEDGGTGRHFRPGDPESLRACIEELMDDDMSLRLGQAAKERYEQEFSPERHLAGLVEIYETARASRKGTTPASTAV